MLTGVVTDRYTSEAVGNASITLHHKLGGDMLAYGITNSKGQYNIILEGALDSVFVSVSCLGYASQQFYLASRSITKNIALSPEAISINEVSVKADKIWAKRDTINYSVAGFASKQDRTIGDVLKKLPGIDVDKNGAISYGGKAINAFYIEGMNSMDGKYTLATENIPADAVANVQIFENHQKVKMLENSSFSDQAALNLTLREASKYRWIGNARMGAGLPVELWDAKLFLMNISKRNQGVNVFEGNNAGRNIGKQLQTFTIEDMLNENNSSLNNQDLFDVPTISIPMVNDERSLFNKSFLASTNNLWMLGKDWTFRLNINYLKDRVTQNSKVVDTYLFPNDSALVIVDGRSLASEMQTIEATFTLNANTTRFYFNNALKLSGNWSSSVLDGWGSRVNMQKFKTPERAIQNDFRLIKRVGGVNVTFASFNRLSKLPQSLEIRQESFDTVFNGRLNHSLLVQDITHLSLISNSSASFTLMKGKWYLENKLGYKLQYQEYTSGLTPRTPVDGGFSNKWDWTSMRYQATPKLGRSGEKLLIELSLPMSVNMVSFRDNILDQNIYHNKFFFTPELSLRYKISTRLEVSSRVGVDQSIGDPLSMSSGYVLSSYRYINRGHSIITERKSQSYTLGFQYRNPVEALFLSASVYYAPSLSEVGHVQSIRGIYVVSSSVERSNSSNFWIATSRISKAIDLFKSTVALAFSYNSMATTILQNTNLVHYTTQSYTINPRVNARPTSWVDMEYNGQISMSQLQIDFSGNAKQPYLHQVYQQIMLGFTLRESLQVRLKGEHFYNEMLTGNSPSVFFFDMGFRLKLKHVELTADWSNILNKKAYAYSSYGSLNSSSSSYEIRPISIMVGASFKF